MSLCNRQDCNNGQIFDLETRSFHPCPFCLEIRSENVEDGVVVDNETISLAETLGFKRIFSRLVFDAEKVFGAYAYSKMPSTVSKPLSEMLESLIGRLAGANIPKTSMVLYLGSKADIELLGYLILANAYKAGLGVHQLVSPFRLRGAKAKFSDYEDIIHADVVVATFSPAIKEDVYIMDDLMKERALNGKPTIFLLSDGVGINSLIQRMCSYDGVSLSQALYAGIPNLSLNDDDDKRLARLNKAIKNGNDNLRVSTPELSMSDIVKADVYSNLSNAKSGKSKTPPPHMTSKEVFGY